MSLFQDQEKRIRVLMALPFEGAYDYLCPPGMELETGDFVRVPLGPRERIGVVWEGNVQEGDVAIEKLKPVLEKIDQPPLPPVMLDFVNWVANYTLQPLGLVLKMVTGMPGVLQDPKPQILYYRVSNEEPEFKLTPARRAVLEVLNMIPALPLNELAKEAMVTPSVVKGLYELGVLAKQERHQQTARGFEINFKKVKSVELETDQAIAATSLVEQVKQSGQNDGFKTYLLDGVPGAGKTEVYFEAIEQALRQNQQIVVLLPEIALSAQWLRRFEKRFGFKPHLWHSDVGASDRKKTWRGIIRGTVPVVVGARSALFLPYVNLGLVVVDEEHDSSFKQEEGVIYNGRDMAIVRAQHSKCPVVLASATPSLETMVNAWDGRYEVLKLSARHGGASLPELEAIDMRLDPPGRQEWISPKLVSEIKATVERGEQVLLYLNRRGYAPLTICRTCGHRLECPNCTSWLVEHRALGRVQCHHCGFGHAMPKACPTCGDENSFAACGPGVERLAEEVSLRFPDMRTVIASSDTLTTPAQAADLVRDMENHEYDLIIGTQMVTKGYHFPLLTLVGVIDADLGLDGGELRACERTYQLLYQVAGRAGRSELPGKVMLQTFVPDHPVMKAMQSGLRDEFLKAESDARKLAAMPPYGRLCAFVISGEDEAFVQDFANQMRSCAPQNNEVTCLGPTRAPMYMIRGRYRMRLLLKVSKSVAIQKLVRMWLAHIRIPSKIRLQVDVDPYSFL